MRQILYVWNYREWGGAQIYFLSLMREAKNSSHVTALLPSDSEPKILQYLESLEVPIEFLSPAPKLNNTIGLVGKISGRITVLRSENRLIREILSRENLHDTIVHIDLGFWQSALTLFRLCCRTDVFVTVHTGLPLYTGWRALRWKIKGKILSRLSSFHILASNQEAKDSLKPYLTSDKWEGIEVTYSGIDPTEITKVVANPSEKNKIINRYSLPLETPILMTVGQFVGGKGCYVVLQSLKLLREAGYNVMFAWLSTTKPTPEILDKIERYDLRESFRLLAPEEIGETRHELLTLLGTADTFVLASFQEGLPIALIEAMALGLPCIATNVNAIPEAVESGQNGILVTPNDPIQLRDAIIGLLNSPEQKTIFGAAAKKTAFEQFNAKLTAERTMKLYDDVWKTQR